MWQAVRTTVCRALRLPAVLFPNQAVMQPVRMLSTGAGVEGSEDSGARSKLPQLSQEEETLMCLLQHCICVSRPCEILGDVNAEEAVYPLHRCLVDGDGCVFSALSPEIHHQLLGLIDVEWEVVLITPFSQGTHLLSVGRLIVVGDQAYHRWVICKFDDDIRAVCCCTVVCVQGVQEWAEDTALWSTSVEDQGRWGDVAHSDHLTSACQEVQDPADLFSPRVWNFATILYSMCDLLYIVISKLNFKPLLWVCMWNEMDLKVIESRCKVKQHQTLGAFCW